jgi:hypothetical protein
MIPYLMLSSQLAERHCGLVGLAWLACLVEARFVSLWAGVKHRRPMPVFVRVRLGMGMGYGEEKKKNAYTNNAG